MFIGIRRTNSNKISKYIIYMTNNNLSVFLQNNIVYILLALLVLYFIFYYKEYFKAQRGTTTKYTKQCMHTNKKGQCDQWVIV